MDGSWNGWNCIGNSIFTGNGGKDVTVLPNGLNADTIFYKDVKMVQPLGRDTTWYKYLNTLNKN